MIHWVRSLLIKTVMVLVFHGVFLVLMMPGAQASQEWPYGWSKPIYIGECIRYGYKIAPADGEMLWLVAIQRNKDDEGQKMVVSQINVRSGEGKEVITIPLPHLLRDFALQGVQDTLHLSWIEREEGRKTHYKYATITAEHMDVYQVWETPAMMDHANVYVSDDGFVYLVWSSMDEGLYSIYLEIRDTKGHIIGERKRLTATRDREVNTHILVDDEGVVHLSYLTIDYDAAHMEYRQYDPHKGVIGAGLNLGDVDTEEKSAPSLFLQESGVGLIWRHIRFGRGSVVYGSLDRDAKWQQPFKPIVESHGYISAPVLDSHGRKNFIVWLGDAGNRFRVEYAVFVESEGVLEHGPATINTRNVFQPQGIWLGDHKAIVYSQFSDTHNVRLYVINDIDKAPPTLAFRLGLDGESPFTDAVYKFTLVFIAAVFLAALALGTILLAVTAILMGDRLNLFPPTRLGIWGRYSMMFLILALLKRTGYIYANAQFLPGISGFLVIIGSMIFAGGMIRQLDMDDHDIITLSLAAFLFIFFDTMCTLYLLGVGLW